MMLPITSSMLSHIGWADDTLFVRYHPTKAQAAAGEMGALWQYKNYVHGLPAETPEEGWGKWFNANVKGKYEGEKVIPEPEFPPASESAPMEEEDW